MFEGSAPRIRSNQSPAEVPEFQLTTRRSMRTTIPNRINPVVEMTRMLANISAVA
jgi:hypothetical protein